MKKLPQQIPTPIFKAKAKDLFYIFFSVWCLDFFTTILALNLNVFEGKFYEMNPLSAWFYSFGLIGWIGAFCFSFLTIFIICFLETKFVNRIRNENMRFNLYILLIFLFVLFEGNVIVNNINLMLFNM